MRGSRVFAIGLIVCVCSIGSGCRSGGSTTRTSVSPEPGLAGPVGGSDVVVDGSTATPPAKTVSVVDRHPLFSKPREYWDTSGDNKIVKAAAATFVGVPVGFYGEMKQIIVGAPPEPKY